MDEFELANFQQVEKLLNHRFIFDEPFRGRFGNKDLP